jgi:hypothetical protein
MKKLLLLFSLTLCSLLSVAQTVNENFTLEVLPQRTDDMLEFTFSYKNVNDNTTFQIYKYLTNDKTAGELSVEFKATERLAEGVTPDASAVYSCYLDGLDLTGNIVYKVGVKAIQETTSGEIKEEIVYVYQPNGQFNGGSRAIDEFEKATEYRFTYGLPNAPVLSEKKSSSVRLTWSAQCNHGTPELYSIFDRNSNVVIATTTETAYLVTNLLAGQTYDFFIRAYKDGNYLSTSPSVLYTPEKVDCVTFISAEKTRNKEITLELLGYGADERYKPTYEYTLYMGDKGATSLSKDAGKLIFTFADNIALDKEFKLVTPKTDNSNKGVGLFKLNSDGSAIDTQYCDIVFDLNVSHVTQYTATLIWTDPGFTATKAAIEIINLDEDPEGKYPETIKIANPRVSTYTVGSLEHSTNYKFILKLSDDYNNQAKAEVKTKTKVGSVCELKEVTSVSWLGCNKNGEFLAPYDVEFYTEYENNKPIVTVRFKLNSTDEINNVKLYYAPDGDVFTTLLNIKSLDMKKGVDGWYSASFDKLSGVSNMDDRRFYFSVAVTPAKRCSYLTNFYLMKPVAYQVGVGCQDEEVFTIISFDKTYADQSQFTLKTNGRMASVGVFPEDGYVNGEFIIAKRMFYNNFDDAPSEFTLDISDFPVGKYYMHIHDVYGEAGDLKYLWAIY